MKLLYCDETNFEKRGGDFFVYGGIAVEGAAAGELAATIDALRTKYGVPRDYLFKFNPGPPGMSHADFIRLKQDTMAAAVEHRCRLLVNLLLHDIAASSEEARRLSINTLCYHFDCLLNHDSEKGIVLIDRFSDDQIDAQLRERVAVGFRGMPYSGEMPIKHIVGIHYCAIGQSQFCSLIDLVLGSLRHAVNLFTRNEQQHMATAKAILSQLTPLFYRSERGAKVHPISLWFSPKEVKVANYRQRYRELIGFLAEQGIVADQSFTG